MQDFMLLVQSENHEDVAPEVLRKRLANYRVWMQEKMAEGRVKAGQPLAPLGALVKRDKSVMTDGPFLEAKEIIAGYVVVSAATMEEAVEIARGCPLLDHCELIVRPMVEVPLD
jgi:hypothetical protein